MTILDLFVYLLHREWSFKKAIRNRRNALRSQRLRAEAKKGF
jgi:hypothetical protein